MGPCCRDPVVRGSPALQVSEGVGTSRVSLGLSRRELSLGGRGSVNTTAVGVNSSFPSWSGALWPKTLHGLCETQLIPSLGHTGSLSPLKAMKKLNSRGRDGKLNRKLVIASCRCSSFIIERFIPRSDTQYSSCPTQAHNSSSQCSLPDPLLSCGLKDVNMKTGKREAVSCMCHFAGLLSTQPWG